MFSIRNALNRRQKSIIILISPTLYQRFSSTLSIFKLDTLLLKNKSILIGIVVMKIRWKILLVSMSIWLVEEISLNLVGLDQFADYSQFLQDKYRHGIIET